MEEEPLTGATRAAGRPPRAPSHLGEAGREPRRRRRTRRGPPPRRRRWPPASQTSPRRDGSRTAPGGREAVGSGVEGRSGGHGRGVGGGSLGIRRGGGAFSWPTVGGCVSRPISFFFPDEKIAL